MKTYILIKNCIKIASKPYIKCTKDQYQNIKQGLGSHKTAILYIWFALHNIRNPCPQYSRVCPSNNTIYFFNISDVFLIWNLIGQTISKGMVYVSCTSLGVIIGRIVLGRFNEEATQSNNCPQNYQI